MKLDTRISVAIALIYLINGIVNSSSTGSFSPLFFIDWFLLAILSLVFAWLPPFRIQNLAMHLFTGAFILEGCFTIGIIKWPQFEIGILLYYIFITVFFYILSIIQCKSNKIILLGSLLLFLLSIFLRYIEAPVWTILSCSGFGALLQVYFIARPDYLSGISNLSKRFLLLMVVTVYFDIIMHIYFMLNKFPVN